MKGILASRYPSEEGEYTNLQVLKSPAGWYIGTMFVHNQTSEYPGLIEPGSRESGYFASKEDATKALETENWNQRSHP